MERIPELDGLRALAALSVFMFHAFGIAAIARFTRSGWIGVDLFFVISGYLITTILLGMRGAPHYFKNFYMRRTLRIFPPYYLFFLICLLAAVAIRSYHVSGRLWLTFALYGTSLAAVQPWYYAALSHLPWSVRAIEVTWSLSIEEIFYLIWAPAVRFLKRTYLLVFVCAVIVLAPAIRGYLHNPDGQRMEYYFFPSRMDTLAFGALLALSRDVHWRFRVPGWSVVASLAAMGSALWFPDDPQGKAVFAVFGYTLIAVTMTLILAFVLDRTGSNNLVCRVLRSRPLVWVGTVSYMFYLLHVMVIRIFAESPLLTSHRALGRGLQITGSLAATLALSALSWKYFESPILRLKSRFESSPRIGKKEPPAEALPMVAPLSRNQP